MTEILLMAMGGAFATSGYSKRVTGYWITGAVVFWVAWLGLALAATVAVALEHVPELPGATVRYVSLAFAGAFPAGLVGIKVAGAWSRRSKARTGWVRLVEQSEWLSRRLFKVYVPVMLIAGMAHFVERWSRVDLDLARLFELRMIFVEEGWSMSGRIASYVSYLGFALLVLFAVVDAERGVQVRRLASMWAVGAPHGLATGGRIWTFMPLVIYVLAYIISLRAARRPLALAVARRLGGLVLVATLAFTALGVLRRPVDTAALVLSPASWTSRDHLMIVTWVGASLLAVAPHSEYAAGQPPARGQVTFEYFWSKMHAAGMVGRSAQERWIDWFRTELITHPVYGFTWCVPPTAIPYLILDYGEWGLPFAMALMVFALHVIGERMRGESLVKHTLALLSWYTLATSVQTLSLFTSHTVAPIVVVWLLSRLVETASRGNQAVAHSGG